MRRFAAVLAALALGAAALAGCAPTPAALSTQVSQDMQSGVVAVAEAAAAGDPTTALARLDELQQRLDAALAAGEVTSQRAAAIQTAIDVVRADLQPAPAPSVEPAPGPTADPSVTDDGTDNSTDNGNGNDNSGPGNNNGNDDKGKGKGKDG